MPLEAGEAEMVRLKQPLYAVDDVHVTGAVVQIESGFGGFPGERYILPGYERTLALTVNDVYFVGLVRRGLDVCL